MELSKRRVLYFVSLAKHLLRWKKRIYSPHFNTCRTNKKHEIVIVVMIGIERLIYRKKCFFWCVIRAAKISEYDIVANFVDK